MRGVPLPGFDRDSLTATLRDGAAELDVALLPETAARLIDYLALLSKWNGVYNLTAVRDPHLMVVQHLLDSLAIVPSFAGATHVLDVGAGGGLPGMVLAIWAAQAAPAMRVAMIDTVHKKTAFLTQVKAELGLANVSVHTDRVEQFQAAPLFDVITSRAFAELNDFINWSQHLLAPQGRFLAMKGGMPQDELQRLPAGWIAQDIVALQVPGLAAQRHLVTIMRSPT